MCSIWANRPDPVPNSIAARIQRSRNEIGGLLPVGVVDEVEAALAAGFESSAGVIVVAGDDGVRFVERTEEHQLP